MAVSGLLKPSALSGVGDRAMASGDLQVGGLVLYSISYVRASTELGSRVRASAETKSLRGWMTRFL